MVCFWLCHITAKTMGCCFFFGDFLGCNDWGTRGYHTYVAILVNSPGI